MKPKILIVTEEGWAKNIQHFIVNVAYGKAISSAGGLPIVATSERSIDDYAELVDGLLLIDGPFVHVGTYGDYYKTFNYPILHRRREIMEFALVEKMLKKGKPVLGVNRGMRVLNVFFGGRLCDDEKEQNIDTLGDGLTPIKFDENNQVISFIDKTEKVIGIKCSPNCLDLSAFEKLIEEAKK